MSDRGDTATVPSTIGILTSDLRKGDEANFIMDWVGKAEAKMQPYFPVWEECLDNYMVASPTTGRLGRSWPSGQLAPWWHAKKATTFGSFLKDPETHQIIESLTAQALLLLLGQKDYITATPVGADDPAKAQLISRLLMAQMDQPGVFRTHYQLFKNAFLFGTSILEISWETRSRIQMQRQVTFDPTTGQTTESLVPQEVPYRDRPVQKEVPLWKFFPDPNGTRIHEDMVGVVKEFEITDLDAQNLAAAGVYDKEGVRKAMNREASYARTRPYRNQEDNPPYTPRGLKLLKGFEFWGTAPFNYPNGASNRVITLLEGEIVRSHINPFIDGAIPFKEIVINPVQGRFYGLGPAEVIRYLQDSADNMLMVTNDAADLAIRSPLLVGSAFGGDELQLRARRLNSLIHCRDPKAVMPLQQDLSVIQLGAQDLMRRKVSMREASGATNPLQAIPSGDRATATEVSALVQYASQRVESMTMLTEREDYPWIGRTLHSRNRQFLPPGGAVVTLLGEQTDIPYDQIDADVDVRFTGSRIASSKLQKVAQLKDAIATIGQNLALLPIMPELFERLLLEEEMPDASEIIKNAILRSEMMSQAGGGMEGTGKGQASPPKRPSQLNGPPQHTPGEVSR